MVELHLVHYLLFIFEILFLLIEIGNIFIENINKEILPFYKAILIIILFCLMIGNQSSKGNYFAYESAAMFSR